MRLLATILRRVADLMDPPDPDAEWEHHPWPGDPAHIEDLDHGAPLTRGEYALAGVPPIDLPGELTDATGTGVVACRARQRLTYL